MTATAIDSVYGVQLRADANGAYVVVRSVHVSFDVVNDNLNGHWTFIQKMRINRPYIIVIAGEENATAKICLNGETLATADGDCVADAIGNAADLLKQNTPETIEVFGYTLVDQLREYPLFMRPEYSERFGDFYVEMVQQGTDKWQCTVTYIEVDKTCEECNDESQAVKGRATAASPELAFCAAMKDLEDTHQLRARLSENLQFLDSIFQRVSETPAFFYARHLDEPEAHVATAAIKTRVQP